MPQGNPKGNPGNKGGGRKSAIVEQSAGAIVKDIFFHEQNKNAVMEKIRSGKYSGFDVLRMKILTGNDRVFVETLKKLVPDLVDIAHDSPYRIIIEGRDPPLLPPTSV